MNEKLAKKEENLNRLTAVVNWIQQARWFI